MKKRRGPTDVSYIDDYHKRKQTLSTRLPSLWKKVQKLCSVVVVVVVVLKSSAGYFTVNRRVDVSFRNISEKRLTTKP